MKKSILKLILKKIERYSRLNPDLFIQSEQNILQQNVKLKKNQIYYEED